MTLRSEYVRLIEETDKVLSAKRGLWLTATTPEDRLKWKVGLNETLDERVRLMKCRDALEEIPA